jgi:hypothetical protein
MENNSVLQSLFKSLFIPLVLLCSGSALSALVIPGIISDSSEIESLHEARLKKAIDFGDRNEDFVSKLNVLKTLMETFNNQNVRMKTSPKELRESQSQFRKEYTEKYLALDSSAWWWYWDVGREAQIFSLLSPAELQLLHKEIFEYGDSVLASKNAVEPLWKYLSSRSYTLSPEAQQKISDLTAAMGKDLVKANQDRNNHVYNISQLFAHSVHRRPRKGLFQRIIKP